MSPCTATRLWLGRLRTPAARGRARRLASCAVNAQYSTGSSQSSHGNNNARPSVLSPGGKSPGGGADVGKRVGRALQALQLEESRGHCDVRGARSLFSEYAADELARLGEILPPGGSRDRWHAAVAAGFSRYRELAPPQRANLVAEAQYLLNAANTREAPREAPNRETTCEERETTSPKENDVSPARAVGPPAEASRPETSAATSARTPADARSAPPWREKAKWTGGKSGIHDSESWESALRQDSRQRAETRQVSDARKRTDDDASTSLDANGPGDPGVVTHAHVGGFVGSLALEEQGGEAWHALRASRLTASAFGNALGFWRGGRVSLWEEKLGLAAPFAGNDATEWGTAREDEAVEAYKRLTGADVSHMLFRVLSPDEAELWLGASPDGLVAGAATKDAESAESDDKKTASSSPPGVLEIKCPWNKGDPLNAVPYPRVPWYYVPQAQGLMAVFDRPYCDVFCYTARNGAAIYRVRRDAAYWTAMYAGLSDFWWQHVVPGKHALAAGEDPERHRPGETHALTEDMKRWSKRIAESAAQRRFSAAETDAVPGEGARPFV